MSSGEQRPGQETRKGANGKDVIMDGPVHGTSQGQAPVPTEKPSQAEGERETIEQDIRSKEAGGELF